MNPGSVTTRNKRGPLCVGWMFTINNPGDRDKPKEFGDLKRAVWQLERGAEETTHYQGYIVLKKRMRSEALHKSVPWLARATLKVRNDGKVTHKSAYDYCTKADTRVDGPWMIGDWSDCTSKSSTKKEGMLQIACDKLIAGVNIDEVMMEYPTLYARYYRGLREIAANIRHRSTPIWRDVEVLVLQGETQLGKSRYAIDLGLAYCNGDENELYILDASNNQNVWFDGYWGQKVIIIDDFGGFIKYRHLLRILDGYKVRLEVKGGFTWAGWRKVIITSNLMPDEWYKKAGENHDLAPLYRRLPICIEIDQVLYTDIPARNTIGRRYTHSGRSLRQLEAIKDRWTKEGKPKGEDKEEGEITETDEPVPGPCLPRCDATLSAGQGDPIPLDDDTDEDTHESQSSFVMID